jgi:hypothetical protein
VRRGTARIDGARRAVRDRDPRGSSSRSVGCASAEGADHLRAPAGAWSCTRRSTTTHLRVQDRAPVGSRRCIVRFVQAILADRRRSPRGARLCAAIERA